MKALKNEFNLYIFNVNFFMPSEKIRFSYIFRRCRKELQGKTGILTVFWFFDINFEYFLLFLSSAFFQNLEYVIRYWFTDNGKLKVGKGIKSNFRITSRTEAYY